jgi:hypothetical protein
MLNMALVDSMVCFSFAMPSKRSGDSDGRVLVTGVLNSPYSVRLRTVRSIFPANLPVIWTPMQTGRGISFTTCSKYTEFVENCSKEGSDSTNPLIRVDVRGSSDDVRPKKKGPRGPRKPMEPLDANLENILALPELQGANSAKTPKPRSGRGVSCPSAENAAPPPTPPSTAAAAPRLASEPTVIPRRPPGSASLPALCAAAAPPRPADASLARPDPARAAPRRRPGAARGPAAAHALGFRV